ncbi:MAG: preprotein translocase subunit SecG [Saprospiraceae bacterium]|nr:preprotein translocase subunit SecG [Saprospiraceae bacterium]
MLTLITILIALDCILLIGVILIQNPKGGGVDSTFGGQSANQMFGAAKSADFIEKLTWWLAGVLVALCVVASLIASAEGNIGNANPEETPTEQPAEPPAQGGGTQ